MSEPHLSVLQAAQQFVQGQHLPPATLYVIATPIGNLADISLRALALLDLCDTIVAEDTRVTHNLLQVYGSSRKNILRSDAYTENSMCQLVLECLVREERVALVSDAGTPAISDPGAAVVGAVRKAGYKVVPLPGASSIVTLLSAAGLQDTSFTFLGFAPTATKEREAFCQRLALATHTQVFFEAPHRALALLKGLSASLAPSQRVVIGRELTKRFETIHSLDASELHTWLHTEPKLDQGELVLAVSKPAQLAITDAETAFEITAHTLLARLLEHLPLKTAVSLTSELSGESKNALYDKALTLKAQNAK